MQRLTPNQDNPLWTGRYQVLHRRASGKSAHRPPLPALLVLYLSVMLLLIMIAPEAAGYPIENGIMIFEWVFILVPCLIFARFFRLNIVRDLRLAGISGRTATGIVLTSVSGVLLTGELVMLQNYVITIPEEYLEMMRDLFTISGRISVPMAFLAFAVSPAICEEFLFRGIILNGLLGKVSRGWAILVSGALFGLFHLDPYRLLGTMVLGFVMGYVAVKAASLSASMLYHLINNSLILLVMNLSPLREIPWLTEEAHVPIGVLFLSAIVFLTGIGLIRSRRDEDSCFGV